MIVITPAPMELGLHEAAYDELVQALADEGLEARIEPPIERRGGVPQEFVDVTVQVLDHVSDHVIELVIGYLLAKLRMPRRGARKGVPRQGVILGPDGEVLRRVEIPSDPAR